MPRRLLKALIIIIPVLGSLLCNSSTLALSIGVIPGKMTFNVRPGSTELQTLYVINQDDQVSDFEVYIEGGNKKWFTVAPGKFTLNGQERKNIEITASPPITTNPQEYDLSICITSVPPGSDLRIGAGVKVPAHVRITQLPVMAIQWWIVSAVILVILAVGALILWRRKVRHA
jgi:hypothetical protein